MYNFKTFVDRTNIGASHKNYEKNVNELNQEAMEYLNKKGNVTLISVQTNSVTNEYGEVYVSVTVYYKEN